LADLILVNINPAYRADELLFTLNNVGIKALITAEHFRSSDYLEIIRKIVPEVETSTPGNLNSPHVPSLKHLILISDNEHKGYFNFDEIYKKNAPDYKQITSNVKYTDPANI
jgi:fatty-acyl-CoA synthase